MAEGRSMADVTVRARKIEGGYESIFDWDDEELVVNYFRFDVIAVILGEELGRKPTPEEVEEKARKLADDPMVTLEALPPVPRPGEEGNGEIANNWNRVRFRVDARRQKSLSGTGLPHEECSSVSHLLASSLILQACRRWFFKSYKKAINLWSLFCRSNRRVGHVNRGHRQSREGEAGEDRSRSRSREGGRNRF